MNKQLITATRAYLNDWADDGHAIIPVNDLLGYGFSGPWLRDLAQAHQSGDEPKWQITVGGRRVTELLGVWTLDLLEALLDEFQIGRVGLEAAALEVGCSATPTGRGTSARLYTAAIRAALEAK